MRLTGVSLLLRRTGKAPPVIAALDHLPCEGRLSRGRSPRKKAPLTGELAEPARPEGLCPLSLNIQRLVRRLRRETHAVRHIEAQRHAAQHIQRVQGGAGADDLAVLIAAQGQAH